MQNSYTRQLGNQLEAWHIMTLLPAGRLYANDGSGPYLSDPARIVKSFEEDIPILFGNTGEGAGLIRAVEEEDGAVIGHIAFPRSTIDLMINGRTSGITVVFDYQSGVVTKIVGATMGKDSMSAAHSCNYSNPLIRDAMERQRVQVASLIQSVHGRSPLDEYVERGATGTSNLGPLKREAMRRRRP